MPQKPHLGPRNIGFVFGSQLQRGLTGANPNRHPGRFQVDKWLALHDELQAAGKKNKKKG